MFAQRELGVSSTPHKIKGGGVGMAAINNHLTESNYPFCENSCKPYRTIHILSQKYSVMKIIFFLLQSTIISWVETVQETPLVGAMGQRNLINLATGSTRRLND
jgi:hypothetical protein